MQKQTLTVLVIEDQDSIARNIAQFLEPKGYILDFAGQGAQGLQLALANYYDLILLDLTLPGMDGIDVCRSIRARADRHIPILMLTARDGLQDKVTGFEVGADDYLTKPFALEELHVRCIALSRRHSLQEKHQLVIGELLIDRKTHRVERRNRPISLNNISYQLLLALAEAYPRVVTRSELSQRIWGDEPTESDALRSHIYQLRKALNQGFDKTLIKTIHGVGFVLQSHTPETPIP
ncbi:response regulator transcription factor [Exilibacterium tricleocarpae]|uniref:Response regulator transcription factor n=1 Tax=Exilibacterium tricleocarpae TaxID=2591008 RepID=A0A545TYX7_9GAMM|nr:response regulator transcription factor [Exilibacterium tricleocarpae]TQV82404.1 response regulator transcription factor [Exilibacterium tricleocarpae]